MDGYGALVVEIEVVVRCDVDGLVVESRGWHGSRLDDEVIKGDGGYPTLQSRA